MTQRLFTGTVPGTYLGSDEDVEVLVTLWDNGLDEVAEVAFRSPPQPSVTWSPPTELVEYVGDDA